MLPLDAHPDDTLELPFGAIAVGLAAVAAAEEAQAVGSEAATGGQEAEEEARVVALAERQQTLLAQLGDVESAPLAFDAAGIPSESTHALALLLTARRATELEHSTTCELVAHARGPGAQSHHAERARSALHAVASEALAQVQSALSASAASTDDGLLHEDEKSRFDAVAWEYCETRRELLERAVYAMGHEGPRCV